MTRMDISQDYKLLWSTAAVFLILPHLNLGLLSDYKTCGDSACESMMSRVQAIRDHHGKDCRFLSFRRGDTIFVYHKLTGKRDDLWAGSIDKQFGYFPKDAVQEEQVHATIEKVVETQKSDFFCMDEFGYPIDSSHLDNDDNDEDAEKIQNQGSETTQITPYTDTNAESVSTSEDVSTEPPVSAPEADGTSTEEDKSKNAGDAAAKEAQEAPAALNEQGGSASSPWLGSSVTGWLGLATEEQPDNLDGEGEKAANKETQAEASFTSSVTGWLGLGGGGQPGDAEENREEDTKTSNSLVSSMTGWLSFGGEKETEHSAEKEHGDEHAYDKEQEPAEKFRSRRMSLDLEGSQLHEEVKKETGALDWLGNGLSNTLGFELTNQESEHETTIQEEEDHPASSSWFDVRIGNILTFSKGKGEADESTGSSIKEAEEDETLGSDSENVDTSQSTEEVRTESSNELNMEETPKDHNVPSETETMPELTENETPSDTDHDFVTQSDINLGPDFSTVDLSSITIIQADEEGEADKTEDMVAQRAKAPNQVDNTDIGVSSDGHEGVENNAETDAPHREISTTVGAEQNSRDSPVVLSSGTAKERNEPVYNQDILTTQSEETSVDNSNQGQPIEGSSAEFESPHPADRHTEIMSDNAPEEDRGTVSTSESTTHMEDAYPNSVSTHLQQSDGDTHTETERYAEIEVEEVEVEEEEKQDEEEEKQREMQEEFQIQEVEEENQVEEEVLKENEKQREIDDFKKEEKEEELQEAGETETQEKQQEVEEEKQDEEEEKQREMRKELQIQEVEEENQVEEEELKENEKHREIDDFKEKEKEEELQEAGETETQEKQQEVEDEKQDVEEEKQREIDDFKKEEKQEELQEAGETETQEKRDEEEGKQREMQEELQIQEVEEENQVEEEVLKENEKQREIDDFKEEEKEEELQEAGETETQEKQQEVEEEKQDEEEEKQREIDDLKKEEKEKELLEAWERDTQEVREEKQDEVEELKEEEELREEKSQEDIEDIKEEVMAESSEKGELEEVDGIKKEDNQEEVGVEEEKQAEEEELKVQEKKHEMEETNELKEEEKQQQIEELKEEKQEDVEELKEVEKEKNEGEEVQSSEPQEDVDRPESESNETETQHERSIESEFTHTERRETENPQMEEVEVKDEMKDLEVEENLEFDRRDEEEEENLKCSNELCPHTSGDGFMMSIDDSVSRPSPRDVREIKAGEQNLMADNDQILADMTGGSHLVPPDRIQEEETRDPEADEGKEGESESNQTWNEDVISNSANSISDNTLGVNQVGIVEEADSDLLYSGETGLKNDVILNQAAENKAEVKNTNLSDDNGREDKAQAEHTESSTSGFVTEMRAEQIHYDHKRDTVENTDSEERVINERHDDVTANEDVPMKQSDGNAGGAEFRAEGGTEDPVSSSDSVEHQAVTSEQGAPHVSQHLSDGDNRGTAATGSGGAFRLFSNAFSYFSETKDSTESASSLDSNTGEKPEDRESASPAQEADSTQVQESLIILSQQQLHPTPSPFIQASSATPPQTLSHSSPLSPTTGSPPQIKTLSRHYKYLLAYMSADEMIILVEIFGGHKLQFLDYILGSTETMTDDDESILSDIERLLHHQRETLVTPHVRLTDAPQEDKDKTRALIALQKLEVLLESVRETFNRAEATKDKATEEESSKTGDFSVGPDDNTQKDEWMELYQEKVGQLNAGTGKEGVIRRGEKEKRSPHAQPGLPQPLEGMDEAPEVLKQILDFVHQIAEDSTTHIQAARELLIQTVQVVSSLPDDIRPGPDLYGVPWEPVIFSSVVGLITVLLFTCRCYSSVKSRMYRSKEQWMAEQVALLLDEKCKVLETLSTCQQEYDELENSLRDSGVLAQTQKTEQLEGKARQLGHAKRELERDLEQLKDLLEQQREHRIEQERRIAVLEESMKICEEETKELQSQDEQAQTTVKVYNMNSERLQRNLETAREENTLLQESNAQLRQQVEGWAERVSEVEAEMMRCEIAHSGMLQDVANKDERIMSLTDRLLRMKGWDSDLEEEEGEEGGEKETSNGTGQGEKNGRGDRLDTERHLQKVQKLIYAAKLNADLKSVDEDKDRAFAKLNDEVKAKGDLLEGIKELENEKLSLQSDTEHYSDQVQRLQQKLNIMTEMYQENELKLHRLLTVEERERLQKEEKLNKADKNIALAMEELNNYRQRAEEMEEELDKSKQSYQTQISAHEKKAHNNWLAARAADRELADIRRENALLRQKLTDTQFKLDTLDKDPYALDSLARPLPFRAERSPYGPSPLGRPGSETRAFLSPPTLMDGPPARLSPRVPRGPVEPPGGQGEMERSGGPHSDSGSNSPTWERDRRGPPPGPPGPLGPPGYMFPEPGGPMYRRPPPPPGAMGFLPPPGPLHPRGLPPGPPHPADIADGTFRENSLGPGEQEHREPGPGDRRTPPEGDPRMVGAPHPGPPMGPMDGPFPRRAPYGPPPPDFYPPRGPGGPPMMPMWAPPPPGVMFPPRFPPGGPLPPPAPHSHHGPPMRPPLPDGLPPPSMGPLPPQQSLPSPPHSQSPAEHAHSPEDAI